MSGALGIAGGYSYRKYTKLSMGFGMSFIATRLQKQIAGYLDLNKDGKVDLNDLTVVEEKTGVTFGIISVITFAGGFGIGYTISIFY